MLTAQVAAGAYACPKSVRVLQLDARHDTVVSAVRCDPGAQETRFTVSPAPRPWMMLEVQF